MIILKSFEGTYSIDLVMLVSLFSILFAIIIIIAKNPIHSILFLIGLFMTISIYLMLTGLVFIGLSYLLVYVGAISILFLFIVMLINIRVSELITEGKNSLILALITIIAFNYSVSSGMPENIIINRYGESYHSWLGAEGGEKTDIARNLVMLYKDNLVGNVNFKYWETVLVQVSHISGLGNILYTSLFIFIILISLILLLALVGVIIIIKS